MVPLYGKTGRLLDGAASFCIWKLSCNELALRWLVAVAGPPVQPGVFSALTDTCLDFYDAIKCCN